MYDGISLAKKVLNFWQRKCESFTFHDFNTHELAFATRRHDVIFYVIFNGQKVILLTSVHDEYMNEFNCIVHIQGRKNKNNCPHHRHRVFTNP